MVIPVKNVVSKELEKLLLHDDFDMSCFFVTLHSTVHSGSKLITMHQFALPSPQIRDTRQYTWIRRNILYVLSIKKANV